MHKRILFNTEMKVFMGVLVLFSMSCTETKRQSPVNRVIKGKLISDKAQMVYLKKVDNFNYLRNDYILDSVEVSSSGEFEFIVPDSTHHLLGLSTANYLPTTYVVLRQAPQLYYYGSCSNFFASEPVFFLKGGDSLDITWYDCRVVDSIVHHTHFGREQEVFRDYYFSQARKLDFYDKVGENVNYEEVWDTAMANRNRILDGLIHKSKDLELSGLDNYFYSEISLSNLNLFLNWYEEAYYGEVLEALRSKDSNHFYNKLFEVYASHQWHPESFEYYKITERYVNHCMNLANREFLEYHVPSDQKMVIAMDVLEGDDLVRYTNLLKAQMGLDN